MADQQKNQVPPYATYASFSNFINGLRENGKPAHITRSMYPGSNSGKASIAATLAYLNLVNEKDEPTSAMQQLTDPSKNYSEELKKILASAYPFLRDGSLDMANTTTDKVTQKFKELGASGSTITKCMAFFLAALKDAKVEVSRYVKTPQPIRGAATKRKSKAAGRQLEEDEEVGEETEDRPLDKERIVVSIHGMEDWEIFVPHGLTTAQWKHGLKMAKFILENYRPAEEPEVGET